jgi:hypothetical protein
MIGDADDRVNAAADHALLIASGRTLSRRSAKAVQMPR